MAKSETNRPVVTNRFVHWFQSAFLCSALLIAMPAVVTFGLFGKSATEKYLTAVAQPMFLICFSMLSLSVVLFWRGQRGAASAVGLIVVCSWLASCSIVRDECYRQWERRTPFVALDELEPYDCVVVLGGGTGIRPDGAPQFGEAGDRSALAARLYHRGLAKRLVTTGDTIRIAGAVDDTYQETDTPAYQTSVLWQELGVPTASIEKLGGENTTAEMKELAQRSEWWKNKRCAIITSAFHMPRAMRLAKQAGIEADPIPSHFRTPSKNRPMTLEDFLPKADKLADMHDLFKEWLAGLVGR